MSEKVKVTKEQAEAIERALKFYGEDQLVDKHCLLQKNKDFWVGSFEGMNDLEMWKLARSIYIGYEVEPEFKVGDYVVYIHDNTVWEIVGELYGGKIHYDITRNGKHKGSVHKDHIRLATPSEITAEKERRTDKKLDRIIQDLSTEERDQLYNKLMMMDVSE